MVDQTEDRTTPTIYGSGLSKTQQYWNQRENPLEMDREAMGIGPGLLEDYLPSTNRRAQGQAPAPDEPSPDEPSPDEPSPDEGGPPPPPDDQTEPDPDPAPGDQTGDRGDRGGRDIGVGGGGTKTKNMYNIHSKSAPAQYSVHEDRQAKGRNYVAEYVRSELPDGNDAAFLMANGKMVDAAARSVQRIPGRTAASKALANRRLNRHLGGNMSDYAAANRDTETHEGRMLNLQQQGQYLLDFRQDIEGLLMK